MAFGELTPVTVGVVSSNVTGAPAAVLGFPATSTAPMVYATLVSSGLPQWATVKGIFRIHSKYTFGPMVGREGLPDFYALEDVPWSMYFFQDYALHGAYWHDGFGWQHSHGCVNLAPLDAKWLFDWTSPFVPLGWRSKAATPAEQGTWVWVHD